MMFDGFDSITIPAGDLDIFARVGGSGPPLLLLHGFPETHLMWREVAPRLAKEFTVMCADLPGYGRSGCPVPQPDHAAHSKRALADLLAECMANLGHARFFVAGHDRGGRVAYRMALDQPARIAKLAVLDIVPTADAWDRADARFALSFWPWSLLAQPEPLPERLISAAPEAVIDDAVAQWGSAASAFPDEVRRAYADALRDPAHVHAICEEYRAAATLDREHDERDLAGGRRIECPTLALWTSSGALAEWYGDVGGPLGIWRRWCRNVAGRAIEGGHFFPEENPQGTAAALARFFQCT